MQIVQVAPFFHPHSGGVESHVRELAREFARSGHDVTVLTTRHRPGLAEEEAFEGYRVIRGNCLGVWFNTPIPTDLAARLRRLHPDVVHLHFPPPLTALFAAREVRRARLPACLTYHCDLYLATPLGALATELYRRALLPTTLDAVRRIIVHTDSYGKTSRGLGGREFDVIPSSVDTHRFTPDVSPETVRAELGLDGQRVLAFTGRLVPHKGVDALLRVLRGLPPDVSLLVIGRGPDLPPLRAQAVRLGVDRRVRFLSDVSDERLPEYVRAADLFVFPSQNRLEGFGLAAAEALASGLPVVVADLPGVREVIEPGVDGLLADPMVESDLATKVMELLEDPGRRAAMGARGRQRALERFDVRAVGQRLLTLYAGLRGAG